MVFKSNFVASIKSNGKILHEDRSEPTSPTVYLPFQSEYSILLNNLYTRKALVKVSIDGTDVLYGKSLIVEPNSTLELERFLEDNDSGCKFKFIEKTKEISDFRGDKIADGILRVEFRFEKEVSFLGSSVFHPYTTTIEPYYSPRIGTGVVYGGYGKLSSFSSCVDGNVTTQCYTARSINDSGITTKGSDSDQKFANGSIGALEGSTHVITLMLRGRTNEEVSVVEPITSRQKIQCNICGKYNKVSHKFCSNCGTAVGK